MGVKRQKMTINRSIFMSWNLIVLQSQMPLNSGKIDLYTDCLPEYGVWINNSEVYCTE